MSVNVTDKINVKLLSMKEYNDFDNKEIVITNFTVDSEEFGEFLKLADDVDKNDSLQIKEKTKNYFSSRNTSCAKMSEMLTSNKFLNNTIYFYVQLAEYFQLLFPTYFAMLEYYILNKRCYPFDIPKPFVNIGEESENNNEDDENCECEEVEKNEIDEEDEISDLENLSEEEQDEEDEIIDDDPIPKRTEEPKITKRTDIKLPLSGYIPTPQIDIKAIEEYIGFIPKIRTRVIDRNAPKKEIENHSDDVFKSIKTFELKEGFSRHDFEHEYRDSKNKRVIVTITDIRLN